MYRAHERYIRDKTKISHEIAGVGRYGWYGLHVRQDGSFSLQDLMRTWGRGRHGLTAQVVMDVVEENMFHKDPSSEGTARFEMWQDGNDVCIRVLPRRGGSHEKFKYDPRAAKKLQREGAPPEGSVRGTAAGSRAQSGAESGPQSGRVDPWARHPHPLQARCARDSASWTPAAWGEQRSRRGRAPLSPCLEPHPPPHPEPPASPVSSPSASHLPLRSDSEDSWTLVPTSMAAQAMAGAVTLTPTPPGEALSAGWSLGPVVVPCH